MDILTAKERADFAARLGLNDRYVWQCMTGRRSMSPAEARRLECVSGGKIMRWQLVRDWHLIWPELITHPGAPAVTVAEA